MHRVPAVVVGMHLGGLAVVRGLAAAGVPVIAVHDDPHAAEMATRHARRKAILPIRSERLIDGLLHLARELPERPVLMATLRLPSLLISAYRARLESAFRFVLPDHAIVRDAENKAHLGGLIAGSGLRLPRTLVLHGEAALAEACGLRFPVILKPVDNDLGYMQRFEKAYILDDAEALQVRVRAIWPHHRELVAQEWIPGGDDALYFCLQYRSPAHGRVASFVGRNLYSWPPGKGATAACTAAGEHRAEVEALADAFFGRLDLTGFCGIELKRDPRTGAFYVIEPSIGRTEQLEEVAILNGVNRPHCAYCDQVGLPLPRERTPPQAHTWLNSITTRRAQDHLRARGLPLPPLRPGRGRAYDAYLRLTDPAPALLSRLALHPRVAHPLRRRYAQVRRLFAR